MTTSGFPSPAEDYVEIGLNWNDHLIRHPAATFPVKITSPSMEPLISNGSYVIVDRSLEPRNHDVIIAIYKDEMILRRFVKNKESTFLVAENQTFPNIEIRSSDEFQIWGIVTFSVQQHRTL